MNDPSIDLTPGALHVWTIRLSQSGDVVRTLEGSLSVGEARRAERYRRERDRVRYVIAHGALRELLAGYTAHTARDLSFGHTTTGKPFLRNDGRDRSLRFNLSHSGDWAIVGVALSAEVGVDVQRFNPDVRVEALAERFFSRSEFEALRALPPDQRTAAFFAAWTRKEAYVKARGDGILDRLQSFSVSMDPERPPALLVDATDANAVPEWTIHDLDIAPGYAAAIAAEGGTHRIRMMCWTPPR